MSTCVSQNTLVNMNLMLSNISKHFVAIWLTRKKTAKDPKTIGI